MSERIPECVVEVLTWIHLNWGIPEVYDTMLDLVDASDPDASVWLEEHPDRYEEVLNMVMAG